MHVLSLSDATEVVNKHQLSGGLFIPQRESELNQNNSIPPQAYLDSKESILRNHKAKASNKPGLPESPEKIGNRTTLCSEKALGGKQSILPSHQVISVDGDQCNGSGAVKSSAQVALKGNCFSFHQQVSKLDHLGDSEHPGKQSGHPSVC